MANLIDILDALPASDLARILRELPDRIERIKGSSTPTCRAVLNEAARRIEKEKK